MQDYFRCEAVGVSKQIFREEWECCNFQDDRIWTRVCVIIIICLFLTGLSIALYCWIEQLIGYSQ